MGYTTDFEGKFDLNKRLKRKHALYLEAFANIRHMKRDNSKLETYEDPIRKAVGLGLGADGEYYVGSYSNANSSSNAYRGQGDDDSIIAYNYQGGNCPSLWCQWIPSEDHKGIEWDGNEKFYCYVEWLEYIISNFLKPWGYKLNGEVKYQGEDDDDCGKIVVKDNVVEHYEGIKEITYRKVEK